MASPSSFYIAGVHKICYVNQSQKCSDNMDIFTSIIRQYDNKYLFLETNSKITFLSSTHNKLVCLNSLLYTVNMPMQPLQKPSGLRRPLLPCEISPSLPPPSPASCTCLPPSLPHSRALLPPPCAPPSSCPPSWP